MIIDKNLQFSADQELTATAASTDYLDLGSDRDIGPGNPLWLVILSKAAPGGTSPVTSCSRAEDACKAVNRPAA